MFITNPKSLSCLYSTKSRILVNYLEKNKIPILSEKNGRFFFSKTEKLNEILNNAPSWIKWLI